MKLAIPSLRILATLAVCGTFALAACRKNAPEAGGPKTPAETVAPTVQKLEPAECGDISRLHVFDDVFLGGQPSAEDLQHAKESGIRTVVNLRKAEELDYDEAKAVADLGMKYVHLPFQAPEELTPEVFDQINEVLASAEGPVFIHCKSANRVGAVWAAHRATAGGIPIDDAVAESKIVGLRSPDYEKAARDYSAK